MPVLIRYCLRSLGPPFLVATLVSLGILDLLFSTRDFIDGLLVKHIGAGNSFRLLFYMQPSYLVLAIPIGYLTAVLMVYGRLSGDRELMASEACGVSPYFLFWPVIAFSLLFSVFLVFFMDSTLPWGNVSWLKLQYKVLSERTSVAIHSGTFLNDFNGYVLYVGDKDEKTNLLERVVVQLVNENGYPNRVIVSRQGTLSQDPRTAHFLLKLDQGTLQQLGEHHQPDPASLVQIKFDTCVLDMDSKQVQNGVGDFEDPRSMHIRELGDRIRGEKEKKMDTRYDEVEFHKKFSIPFSALAFAFIGIPLGMRAKSGSVLSPVLAVILVVIYELFIMYGQAGGPMGLISPFWAMWLPNLFLTLVGLSLLPYFFSGLFRRSGQSRVGPFRWKMVLAICGWALAAPGTWAASSSLGSSVHLQADRIEYLRDQGLVVAKGRVHLTQDQTSLFSDNLRYDTAAKEVDATGHVVFQQGAQEIDAHEITYNTGTQEGKALGGKTTMAPWICTGDEIDFLDKKIVVKNARATSCDYDLDYTHYHLQAGTLTFYDDNTMTAENLVLYIGKVPVFYFPFFAMNTKKSEFPFSISVGESAYLGNYALVSTSYLINPSNYGALYADYFSNQGLGLGLRHEIALNDYSTLSLYGYRVQEKSTGRVRWESRIRGLWALSSSFQGRVEADLPGDGFFSQDYAAVRRDPSLVSTQREYDVSATYSRDPLSVGVLFRHQEISNSVHGAPAHFVETQDSLPQINASLFPQSLIGQNWLKYDLTLNADRTWTQANDFYVTHVSGEFGISQTIPFTSTQSLYTRAALDDAYQNLPDLGQSDAGETRSFSLNNVYTAHWTDYLDTSFNYNYAQKLTHRLPTDPPGGVSANLLTGNLEFIGGPFFRSNTSTSVNFAIPSPDLASQFSFLRQEIYLTPAADFDFYNVVDYSIKANALKDLSTRLSLSSPRGFWQFILGANVVDPNVATTGYSGTGEPRSFSLSGEVDVALFTNYRLSYLETYDMTNARMETRSISLYRDLHDWEAQLSYSQVEGAPDTVFFTLNLKAFPGRPLTISQTELQQLNNLQTQSAVQLLQTTSDQLK